MARKRVAISMPSPVSGIDFPVHLPIRSMLRAAQEPARRADAGNRCTGHFLEETRELVPVMEVAARRNPASRPVLEQSHHQQRQIPHVEHLVAALATQRAAQIGPIGTHGFTHARIVRSHDTARIHDAASCAFDLSCPHPGIAFRLRAAVAGGVGVVGVVGFALDERRAVIGGMPGPKDRGHARDEDRFEVAFGGESDHGLGTHEVGAEIRLARHYGDTRRRMDHSITLRHRPLDGLRIGHVPHDPVRLADLDRPEYALRLVGVANQDTNAMALFAKPSGRVKAYETRRACDQYLHRARRLSPEYCLQHQWPIARSCCRCLGQIGRIPGRASTRPQAAPNPLSFRSITRLPWESNEEDPYSAPFHPVADDRPRCEPRFGGCR